MYSEPSLTRYSRDHHFLSSYRGCKISIIHIDQYVNYCVGIPSSAAGLLSIHWSIARHLILILRIDFRFISNRKSFHKSLIDARSMKLIVFIEVALEILSSKVKSANRPIRSTEMKIWTREFYRVMRGWLCMCISPWFLWMGHFLKIIFDAYFSYMFFEYLI